MPKIPLILGDYRTRSIIASAQRCVNLFGEPNPKDSETPFTFYPTPGLKLLGSANPGSAGGSPAGGGPPNQGGGGQGGGGSTPPPVPPSSYVPHVGDFSWQLQTANFGYGLANDSDTSGGLLFYMPYTGSSTFVPGVLKQNAGFPGGPSTTLTTPFTFDVGFTTDLGTGAGNPLPTTCGIFIGETASRGPVGGGQNWRGIMFGLAQNAPLTSDIRLAYIEIADLFTNGPTNLGTGAQTYSAFVVSPKPVFFRIVSSGGTFSLYYGSSLGSLALWMSVPYNQFLQNPVNALTPIGLLGLAAYDINGPVAGVNTTYFYYRVY